jgi:ABC-type antimicrobial peptide transport system permease subunit
MIRTRSRKILRDVWARKGRTILVATAIFIGVTGTIALFSMNRILTSQLNEDLQEEDLSMLESFITIKEGAQVDNQAALEALSNVEAVTEVLGGISTTGYIQEPPRPEGSEDGGFLSGLFGGEEEEEVESVRFVDLTMLSFTVPYEEGLPIEPMRLVEGAYPQPGANQIVFEQRAAEDLNVAVGDTVFFRVLSPSKETGDLGAIEPWTVSGLVFHPYSQQPKISVYGLMDDVGYLGAVTGMNALYARFEDYQRDVIDNHGDDAFTDVIANETDFLPVFTIAEDPEQNSLIASVTLLTGFMQTLAIIALIVSGFLVVNVISSIVVEQKRQIGVMKSMGASGFDAFYIYSGIAFMYGLIGVIPGVLVGIPLGNLLSHALAPQLNTLLEGFKYSPFSIGLGIIMGLAIPVVASILPVYFGTRVLILDAMTDLGISDSTITQRQRNPFGVAIGLIPRFFLFLFIGLPLLLIGLLPLPINIRQAIRGIAKKQGRVAFTVITLSIAVGAFMGIFGIFQTLTSGINEFIETYNVQLAVFPTEGRQPEELIAVLEQNFMVDDETVAQEVSTVLATELPAETVSAAVPELMDLRPNIGDKNITDTLKEASPDITQEQLDAVVPQLLVTLRKGDWLKNIEPGFQSQVEFEGYDPVPSVSGPPGIFGYGYDVTSDDPAFKFEVTEGEPLTEENAATSIIFSSNLANNMEVGIGDTVVMRVPGNTVDLTVVGISEFPLDQVYLDWHTLALATGYTLSTAEGVEDLPPAESFVQEERTVSIEGFSGDDVRIIGLDQQFSAMIAQGITEGEMYGVDQPGAIISRPLAEAGSYSIGDTLTLTSTKEGGISGEFPITGIMDIPEAETAMGIPTEVIAVDYMELARLEGLVSEGGEEIEIPQGYFITTTLEDPKSKDLEEELDAISDVMLDAGVPIGVFNFVELVEVISGGFLTFQIVLQAVALLIALIGALGLLTTLSISVFERQKEIGVMRSIGAGSGTVATQFLTEGLVVGIIAWLVGIPLGIGIQRFLLWVAEFDEVFPFEPSILAIVLGLIGMLVITTVASLVPSLSAARKTVSDILRYQ